MEIKQAIKEKTIVFINGRPANIIKNKGVGNEWKIENSNIQTLAIIEALLINKNSSFKYEKGITVIKPLSTVHLVGLSNGITRPSNHIGIIREYVGSNVLLTYSVKNERPFYGIIKSNENIRKMEELKEEIVKILSKKNK